MITIIQQGQTWGRLIHISPMVSTTHMTVMSRVYTWWHWLWFGPPDTESWVWVPPVSAHFFLYPHVLLTPLPFTSNPTNEVFLQIFENGMATSVHTYYTLPYYVQASPVVQWSWAGPVWATLSWNTVRWVLCVCQSSWCRWGCPSWRSATLGQVHHSQHTCRCQAGYESWKWFAVMSKDKYMYMEVHKA